MQLTEHDAAEVERIRGNLTAYAHRRQAPRKPESFYPEWAGVFEVNVETLLDIIARASAAELVPSGVGWPGA